MTRPGTLEWIVEAAEEMDSFMTTFDEWTEELAQLSNLQECILLDVQFRHFQTVAWLLFNNIWSTARSVRRDISTVAPVSLVFTGVQRIEFVNALNRWQIEEPERMNWGMNEIALVSLQRIGPANESTKEPASAPFRVIVLWEGDRRITIDFHDLHFQQT